MRTINPVWEEGFIFFISNPDSDALDLKVLDAKTESELCLLNYNISNLSNKENLEILQQPFRLAKGTAESKLMWSLHLKARYIFIIISFIFYFCRFSKMRTWRNI